MGVVCRVFVFERQRGGLSVGKTDLKRTVVF